MRNDLKGVLLCVLVAYLMVAIAFFPFTASPRTTQTGPKTSYDSRGTNIDILCTGGNCKRPNPNAETLYTFQEKGKDSNAPMNTGSRAVSKYAVLAGVSDYPGTGMDLNYCHWDVFQTRDMLITMGWPAANIHILLNESATQAAILNEINWLKGKEDASSQTWFHFSGHGNSGYFLVYDTQMTDDTLANAFTGFESTQQIIVMDTCFAGSFTALNRANTIGMMACSNNEYSYDGMFTPNLVAGFKDLSTSVEVAFQSAKTATSTQTGGAQNPIIWDNIAGDLLIGDKAPTIGAIPDFSAPEDTKISMTLTPYEQDEEDTGTSLKWYISNYEPTAIATKMGERSDNDTIILSPQLNYFGSSNLELTLVDSAGQKATKTIQVTWTPVNDVPTVASLDRSKPTVLRTQQILFKLYGNDVDNLPAQMTTEFEVTLTGQTEWYSLTGAQYKQGHWEVEWTPDANVELGLYDVRARIKDPQGEYSQYLTRNGLVTVHNNLPTVTGIMVPSVDVERTRPVSITIFGSDIEDGASELAAELEVKAPDGDFKPAGAATFVDGHWDAAFTPLMDARLGWYDMRARLRDADGDYGSYYYKNNSIEVKNCRPTVLDIVPDQFTVVRGSTISLLVTGIDAEDANIDLTLEVQMAGPDGEWSNVNQGVTYGSDQWTISISPPIDETLGNYSYRARLIDQAEAEGDWFLMNGSIEVKNSLPVVTSVQIDLESVVRTQSITIYITGADLEDVNSLLTPTVQLTLHDKTTWDDNGIGAIKWVESKGAYSVDISPDAKFTPGSYDLRVRLTDTDGGSGTWFTSTKHIQVLNGPPTIDLVVPTMINEGEPASFDGSGSRDPEGGSLMFIWEFGDGTVGDGAKPTHIYKAYGGYSLKLKVRDLDGLEVTKEVPVKVNGLPTGDVGGLQDTGFNNFKVKFESSQIKDPEGKSLSYQWDFDISKDTNGDGNPANDVDSTEANPTFNYGKGGDYDYKVIITDTDGGTTVRTGKVTVSSMSSFTIGLLVLVIVLISVIAVAAVLLMKRKKGPKSVSLQAAPKPKEPTRSLLDSEEF